MKYDFELDTENSNSLSIILKQLKKNSVVLEFGPANGRLTRYMKEELGCKVYLVEIDEEAGRQALQYAEQLVVGDIEDYEWLELYKDISFDHIIYADVLEHLRNPQKVLEKSKELLKEQGTILLSVPNLAHSAVVIDLLNDKFEYQSVGLLDDTHIHFFTRTTLEKMIAEAGLYTDKKMATYAKVGTIEIKNAVTDVKGIRPSFWNRRERGDIYQYVYQLSKTENDSEDLINGPDNIYYCQMYYDDEEKWTEEKSEKKPVDISQESQSLTFQMEEPVQGIRLDPLNTSSIVIMESVMGYAEEECVEAVFQATNARETWQKTFYFDAADPCVIYRFEKPVNRVEVKYRICDVDTALATAGETICAEVMKDANEACRILNTDKFQLTAERDSLRAEIEKLSAEIQRQNSEYARVIDMYNQEKARADLLQLQREQLESRRIYKIYKFLKRK